MNTEVKWTETVNDKGRLSLSETQLTRARGYMNLLIHPMNVDSKISSFAQGRGVLVSNVLARDVLRAAEATALPCTTDHPEVVAAREALNGDDPVDPVMLAILETSEHKLTILDGFETVCAVYAEDAVDGTVRVHLLRLPI